MGRNKTAQIELDYSAVNRLSDWLRENGLPHDPRLLNMFAGDIIHKLVRDKVSDTNISMNQLEFLMELTKMENGLAAFGAKGAAEGFSISKINTQGLKLDRATRLNVEQYNSFVDKILKDGRNEAKDTNVVAKGEDYLPADPKSIAALGDMARRYQSKKLKVLQKLY